MSVTIKQTLSIADTDILVEYFFHTAEFDHARQAGEGRVLSFRASEPAWK